MPADPRLHALATDAAASVEAKEKEWVMLELSFESSSAIRRLCHCGTINYRAASSDHRLHCCLLPIVGFSASKQSDQGGYACLLVSKLTSGLIYV